MRRWWRRQEQMPATRRAYPPMVGSGAERRRWDLAEQAAREVVSQVGGDEFTVLLATRSLYLSDIPTH